MIDTTTLDRDRQEFQRAPFDDRLARISSNLRRIAGDMVDPAAIDAAKQLIDETAWFCEWTIPGAEDADIQATLLDCARLMSRCRMNWEDVVASAELRR